jgi:hypothetical protein
MEGVALPAPVQREIDQGIPDVVAGKSAFAFCRVVRQICRANLGLYDFDVRNSYFAHLVHCAAMEAPGPLIQYVENRDECLAGMRVALSTVLGIAVSVEHTKNLFILLGFGGSVDGWCRRHYPEQIEKLMLERTPAAWIYEFQGAMELVLKHIGETYPTEVREAFSESTLAFHFYSKVEESTLLKMIAAIQGEGGRCVSKEHDGLVAKCTSVERTLEAIQKAVAPLVVVCKPIPEDPLYEAKRKFPEMDWEARSRMPLDEYVGLWTLCKEHIKDGDVPQNTMSFAEFVAARLDCSCVVPPSDGERRQCFELYHGKGWAFHNAADMKTVIARELRSFALPPYLAPWDAKKPLVPLSL